MGSFSKRLRTARRCFWILSIAGIGLLHFGLRRLRGPMSLQQRAHWLQIYTRWVLPHLGVQWTTEGAIPTTGLIVSNHLSYVDILVFSAAFGCSFVSKAEVKDWPIFGPFAKLSGSVFVWRHSAADSARAYEQLTACLKTGHPVTVFPETTTTNGTQVLPFRSTMFQAAIDAGVPVTPACIGYSLADGSVADDICFWGDHEALPHALNLFSKRHIDCVVRLGEPLAPSTDRKQIARMAFEWVLASTGLVAGHPSR